MNHRFRSAVRSSSLALALLSTGCASQTFFGKKPPTWPREGPVPVKPTLKPVARDHVETPDGEIEIYKWNLRRIGNPGRRAPRTPPYAVVLLSPGSAMPVQLCGRYVKQLYAGRDIVVVGWNYPGFGSSTGPTDLKVLMRNALRVYDHVAKRYNRSPIIVHGISLGGCPSLHIATEHAVAGVVLDSPIRATHIAYEPEHGWWNLWIASLFFGAQVPTEYDILETARHTAADCPLLVIHGQDDDLVPAQHGVDVFNAWPYAHKDLLVIPDAGHYPSTIETAPDDYRRAVRKLLKEIDRD
jgi:pimeloyl-ACP methyl ester carboxylesterase